MPSTRRLEAIGIAVLAFSMGCDFAKACTLIGCVNGLFVEFSTSPTTPYRVEVQGTNSFTVNVYECAVVNQCFPGGAYFEDYYPQTVTIKVITATGTTTTTLTPEYVESQPNGKGCGPTCRSARVTVPTPAP